MLDPSKIKTEWNLNLLLSDEKEETIQKELGVVEKKHRDFIDKWKSREDYLNEPKILLEALKELEILADLGGTSGNVGLYFGLKSSLNQEDPTIKAWENKIDEVGLKLAADMEFFTQRISKIAIDKQPTFLNDAVLTPYNNLLKSLFENAKYQLTEPEEKVLTLFSPSAFSNWIRMTSEFITTEEREVLDDSGKTVSKNFSDMMSLLASPDVKIRESSAAAIDTIFAKHLKVGEAELNSIFTYKKTSDALRGFSRPDQPRHISDDIPSPVVDLLLDVVSSNNQIVHDYYALKAKLLGLNKIRYFERNILYKGMDKKYSFENAVQLVHKTMQSLDPAFSDILEKFLYNGQIDVFTKKGKSSSQFCAGGSKLQPVFIQLNFGSKVEDASTLAHEMGHGINDEFVKAAQNSLNLDVPLCLAETASTFFEDFILDELEKSLDEESRLALMIFRLDASMNTVFRQIACYKFEQDLHTSFRTKGFLSKDEIGELFVNNMSVYCGPSVEITPTTKNWWLHWGHIRRFFYVYSYAFGNLVSTYMQDMVRKDASNITRVKKFLSAGSAKSTVDILKDIDIDASDRGFWETGIMGIKDRLDQTTEFARKLGKI